MDSFYSVVAGFGSMRLVSSVPQARAPQGQRRRISCGVWTMNSETKKEVATAHYSRVICRGARRFDSQGAAVDLQHVGLENPDSQRVLVVTNAGRARVIEQRLLE
jgi:hypothetical protein